MLRFGSRNTSRWSVRSALCAACAAALGGCSTGHVARSGDANTSGVAWRTAERSTVPPVSTLTLGAGDRIGTRLEEARVARAIDAGAAAGPSIAVHPDE